MTDSEKHQDDQAADDAESSRKRSETWSEAHEAFERLSVEEKAFFLVESAFDTVLSGLREAGDVVKDAMEDALSDLEKRKQEARRRANTEGEAAEEQSEETQTDGSDTGDADLTGDGSTSERDESSG